MDDVPGMIRPDLQALPQVRDRMTFLYLEHCTLGRQDGAITGPPYRCRSEYRRAYTAFPAAGHPDRS